MSKDRRIAELRKMLRKQNCAVLRLKHAVDAANAMLHKWKMELDRLEIR